MTTFPTRSRSRGISLVYTIVVMSVMLLFCSLGVDVARMQVARTEMRRTVDAAARYGAAGFFTGYSTAISRAVSLAAENKVDGQPLTLIANNDIRIGKWDPATKTFTPLTGAARSGADAIEVTGRRLASRGTGIPLSFASIFGMSTIDIKGVTAIARYIPPINVDHNVPATANPFLSGMPAGSMASNINPHNNPDYAGTASSPRQMPLAVKLPIKEGDVLTFDNISGTANHDPDDAQYTPDGKFSDIGHNNLTRDWANNYNNQWYSQNGIADMKAPINALVGIFMSDEAPNKTTHPKSLDFSSTESRNFSSLKPEMKQIFFIGDGKMDDKTTRQQFVVPKGATRLFLATWDFYEWNNNGGYRNIRVDRPGKVELVK